MNLRAGPELRILTRITLGSAFFLLSALSLSGHADTEFSLATTLSRLEQSKSGRALVQRAMGVWSLTREKELIDKLKWGSTSRTDAVLIRRYDVETGNETRDRKVTVYLREHQSLNNTVLDMAHELVHATTRPEWDPYDPTLTAAKYIKTSIEGTGGEVEAVLVECRISAELGIVDMTNRCQKYSGGNVTEKVRQDFYRVGKWLSQIKTSLGSEANELPLLSAEAPTLYSSTGGAPYPSSLLDEYTQMTQVACANSKRRAETQDKGSIPDRSPSSLLLSRRCGTLVTSQ